tara:strand:+ start:57 stop:533 length:477 start_codon:yes stop_codon:yes gene_type:complete
MSITAKSNLEKAIVLFLPLAIGIGLIAISHYETIKSTDVKHWPARKAVVIEGKIKSRRGNNNTTERYYYMVGKFLDNGVLVRPTRFSYGSFQPKASEKASLFPVGKEFTVFTNPQNTRDTVLSKISSSNQMLWVFIVGCSLAVLAIIGFFFVKVNKEP